MHTIVKLLIEPYKPVVLRICFQKIRIFHVITAVAVYAPRQIFRIILDLFAGWLIAGVPVHLQKLWCSFVSNCTGGKSHVLSLFKWYFGLKSIFKHKWMNDPRPIVLIKATEYL